MTFIKTNFDLCTGCCICQMVCSMRFYQGCNPRHAMLLIEHKKENLYHKPVVCSQCDNAYCKNSCPVDAFFIDEKTSAVMVDDEKCTGCGICVEYCPEGLIRLDPLTERAVKCDLCNGLFECVDACPTKALELINI